MKATLLKSLLVLAAAASTPLFAQEFERPCAREGQVCSINGVQDIYYGANGVYALARVQGGISCTNGAFGRDPVPGVVKTCWVGRPFERRVLCSEEGGQCLFGGSRLVLYGANGIFAARNFRNGVSCSNAVFGDPTPNVRKECFVVESREYGEHRDWRERRGFRY